MKRIGKYMECMNYPFTKYTSSSSIPPYCLGFTYIPKESKYHPPRVKKPTMLPLFRPGIWNGVPLASP